MPFKPLPIKALEKYIKSVGWTLEKGKIDWNLYNEMGDFICSIIISHGKRRNRKLLHSVFIK